VQWCVQAVCTFKFLLLGPVTALLSLVTTTFTVSLARFSAYFSYENQSSTSTSGAVKCYLTSKERDFYFYSIKKKILTIIVRRLEAAEGAGSFLSFKQRDEGKVEKNRVICNSYHHFKKEKLGALRREVLLLLFVII
jgi:hypothetical protein